MTISAMDELRNWNVYLAGEVHSDWRSEVVAAVREHDLPISFLAPVTDHSASDQCGVNILGPEDQGFWADRKGASINAIRTRTCIKKADVVVVKFGPQYRQWNAAFDAGYAAAIGKPIITLHDPEFDHALKEVDAAALATTRMPSQVAQILSYVIDQV